MGRRFLRLSAAGAALTINGLRPLPGSNPFAGFGSVNDIFDPKFKGQVTMLTEMRDTFGLVMLGMGKDPTKVTKADVEAAAAKIKKARTSGQMRSVRS